MAAWIPCSSAKAQARAATAVAVLTVKLTVVETAVEELGAMAAHLDFLEGEHEALRCSIEQLRAKTEELDRRSQRG